MACTIEVCVDSLESCLEAERGGADRVELCSSLVEGGVTPSHGLIHAACRSLTACKVHVLVRPRPGDFLYSDFEIEVIKRDVIHAVDAGAHGIVLGMMDPMGNVDLDRTRYFADMCSALGVDFTFHRAFDVARDQRQALEDLIACRVPRVLTSGGARTAVQALERIAALVQQADGRIAVMPGAGINDDNVAAVVECTGCSEVHGSFRVNVPSAATYSPPDPLFAPPAGAAGGDGDSGEAWGRLRADGDAIARARRRLAQLAGGATWVADAAAGSACPAVIRP